MSPRAACRLEQLGYPAYDYAAGKADWLAFGLPYEGSARLITGLVSHDVPTCEPTEPLGDVRTRLDASRFAMAVVTSSGGVVLGRLDRDALAGGGHASAQQAMSEGPTTVRPSEDAAALAERMRTTGVAEILVTRSDGTLVGILELSRAETAGQEG